MLVNDITPSVCVKSICDAAESSVRRKGNLHLSSTSNVCRGARGEVGDCKVGAHEAQFVSNIGCQSRSNIPVEDFNRTVKDGTALHDLPVILACLY